MLELARLSNDVVVVVTDEKVHRPENDKQLRHFFKVRKAICRVRVHQSICWKQKRSVSTEFVSVCFTAGMSVQAMPARPRRRMTKRTMGSHERRLSVSINC